VENAEASCPNLSAEIVAYKIKH